MLAAVDRQGLREAGPLQKQLATRRNSSAVGDLWLREYKPEKQTVPAAG